MRPGPHVAGTDLRLARECVRAAVELYDHRVDVPEAVAEHDLVVRPAEARDVSLGVAEQARGPEEATSRLALLLFGELAPFAADLQPLVDPQPAGGDSRFHARRVEARADHARELEE